MRLLQHSRRRQLVGMRAFCRAFRCRRVMS
jgi:hypothetical protein